MEAFVDKGVRRAEGSSAVAAAAAGSSAGVSHSEVFISDRGADSTLGFDP